MVNFANRNYSVLHFSLLVLQHFISGPSVKMREAFYIYYYFFEYISRGKWMIKDRGGKTIHGQSFFSDCPSERAEEEEMFPPWCQQSKDFYPSKGGPMVKIYAFLSLPFLFSSLLPHSLHSSNSQKCCELNGGLGQFFQHIWWPTSALALFFCINKMEK